MSYQVYKTNLQHTLALLFSILLSLIFSSEVVAIELGNKGNSVFLSGPIKSGDQFLFKDFLSANSTIKYVDLNSSGGNIRAAGEIGRQIREKNLHTIVDGSRSKCGSSCTILFASGAQRFYVNGASIKDGVRNKNGLGLGYHEGNDFLADGKRGQSGAATGHLIGWYYEFGSKAAASLATKADWKHFYYVSPETAISLGLATSTRRY